MSLSFRMPRKVTIDVVDETSNYFILEPLEKGYATTIGNSLRRVLLSSLEGYAITSVQIPKVMHEFSTIEGVVEDMMEIILNLKRVRFKKINEAEESNLKIKIEGKDRMLAEDLVQNSSSFKVLNPDLVICNLNKSTKLEMSLTIEKGRGYIPSEENKKEGVDINTIFIDSIYSPIINVKFEIEDTRVEQRIDYEKLIMHVTTDGSIDPENAMREATDILMKHYALLSSKGFSFEPVTDNMEDNIMDDKTLKIRKLLQTPITRLNLSVRAFNCLKANNINILADLAKIKLEDLQKFRNLGKKSIVELKELLDEKELKFGMDLGKYKLEDIN